MSFSSCSKNSCQSVGSGELMDDLFSCTICFLPFNESENLPKLLACHHTFCRKCLYQLYSNSEKLTCPVCSEECKLERKGIDSLSTNYYLYKFTEVLKNLRLTDEGESSLKSFSKESENSLAAETCSKHGGTKKYFWCNTCSEIICIHCMGIDHTAAKNHQVEDLSQAIYRLRDDIIYKIETIKKKLSNIEVIKSKVTACNVNLLKVSKALENIFAAPSKTCEKSLTDHSDIDKTLSAINLCCVSETFEHDPHALIVMKNQVEELLLYYINIDEFYEQKYKEFRLLQDSRIMLSVIRPDVKFDYQRIYCIRCGELCLTKHPVQLGKENPCNTKFTGNFCKNCGIVMMEFP